MTTCAQAIQNWETKENVKAAEATSVQLYCQIPPINKLDASLNNLTNCEKLSLSTNCIERMIPLPGLTKLKILSVGRNMIKKIEKLEENAGTLTELWASYNLITSLDGVAGLPNLEILFFSNNGIADWAELTKLAACPKLKDVLLVGNPIYEGLSVDDRRIKVLQYMTENTEMVKIDNVLIKPSEREAAAALAAVA